MLSSSFRRAATTLVRGTSITARTVSTTTALKDSYEYIKVETQEGSGVGLIQLNRPKALNALCDALFDDLIHAARALDASPDIGCMVLTGSPKAFAAGADIAEMSSKTFDQVYSKVRYCGCWWMCSVCAAMDSLTLSFIRHYCLYFRF